MLNRLLFYANNLNAARAADFSFLVSRSLWRRSGTASWFPAQAKEEDRAPASIQGGGNCALSAFIHCRLLDCEVRRNGGVCTSFVRKEVRAHTCENCTSRHNYALG